MGFFYIRFYKFASKFPTSLERAVFAAKNGRSEFLVLAELVKLIFLDCVGMGHKPPFILIE